MEVDSGQVQVDSDEDERASHSSSSGTESDDQEAADSTDTNAQETEGSDDASSDSEESSRTSSQRRPPSRQSSGSDVSSTRESTVTKTSAELRLPASTWSETVRLVDKLIYAVDAQPPAKSSKTIPDSEKFTSLTIAYDGRRLQGHTESDGSDTDTESAMDDASGKALDARLASAMSDLKDKSLPYVRRLELVFDNVQGDIGEGIWRSLLLPLMLIPRDLEDCAVIVTAVDGLAPPPEVLSWAIRDLVVDVLDLSYEQLGSGLLLLPRGVRDLKLRPVPEPKQMATYGLSSSLVTLEWDDSHGMIMTESLTWGPVTASVHTPDCIAACLAASQHGEQPAVYTKTLFSNPDDRMPLLKELVLLVDLRVDKPNATSELGSPYNAPRDLTWHFPALKHLAMPAAFFPWFTHGSIRSATAYRGPLPGERSWDGFGNAPTNERYPKLRYLLDEEYADANSRPTVNVSVAGKGQDQHQRISTIGGHIYSGGAYPLEVCVAEGADALSALIRHGSAASLTFLEPTPAALTTSADAMLSRVYALRSKDAALPYWPVRYVATFPGGRERETLSPVDRTHLAFILYEWPSDELARSMATICFFWASRIMVVIAGEPSAENNDPEYSKEAESQDVELRKVLTMSIPLVAIRYRQQILEEVEIADSLNAAGFQVEKKEVDIPISSTLSQDGNSDWDDTKPPDVTILRVGRPAKRYGRHPAMENWRQPRFRGSQPNANAAELLRAWYKV
jgi:hypothetical protein